jgi:large subunit ribosomal protein L22
LDIDIDKLYVKTAVANEGPRMKRIRPAPMGRAFRYQRRIAHIIITVAEKKSAAELAAVEPVTAETVTKPVAKKAAAKKAPAKKAAVKKSPAKKAVAK